MGGTAQQQGADNHPQGAEGLETRLRDFQMVQDERLLRDECDTLQHNVADTRESPEMGYGGGYLERDAVGESNTDKFNIRDAD